MITSEQDHKNTMLAALIVETAAQHPFMQGKGWRPYHVLEASAIMKRLPTEETERVETLLASVSGPLHATHTLELLNNLVTLPVTDRTAIYDLSTSTDWRKRDLALTRAIARPPMPDPRIAKLKIAIGSGNLAWPTSAVCSGPPSGTLMLRVSGSAGA